MDSTFDIAHVLGKDDQSKNCKTYAELQPVPFAAAGGLEAYLYQPYREKHKAATGSTNNLHDLIDLSDTRDMSFYENHSIPTRFRAITI